MQEVFHAYILVIDDEKNVRESVKNYLEDYDYRIVEADNGVSGLNVFRKEKPDLVLVDLRMPEGDGLEVLSWINTHSPDTPVIIMSGTGVLGDVVEALRLGAWNYLLKPIGDLNVLKHAVEKALERAHLIRENRIYQGHLEDEVNNRTRELEETTQELRKSEEKYRSIFENLQDAYFETNIDGDILEMSPSIEVSLHYTREEVLNMSVWDLYVNPDERKQMVEQLIRQEKITDYEIHLLDKNGSIVQCSVAASLKKDGTTQNKKICGTIRDINERKRAEAEKQKLMEQLYQSQKIEALGSLTGGIAHDFNNILTVINGHAEIALRKMEKNIPVEKDVNAIFQAGKRAENLTRQLLAFSRKQIFKPKVIDINSVISELEKMLVRLIGEDINLNIHFGTHIPFIKADPGQVEQILINLVVNARDAINEKTFSSQEKKRITISTDQTILDSSFVANHPGSREGLHTVLIISDTGIGMPIEVQKKIFEPFFTTKPKGKGTGLGMSTVYGIVKQNNGCVYVYSEIGSGSTFKIYWPSTVEQVSTEIEGNLKASTAGLVGHETILLVEDDGDVRNFAVHTLKELGYNVIEAANGKKALDLIEKKNPSIDLLFTDLIMPEMNGKDLAEKIAPLLPHTNILYASGYTDEHIFHRYELEEGFHFIQKPYSYQTLAQKIRDMLDKKF